MELFIGGAVGVLVVVLIVGGGVLFMRNRIAPVERQHEDQRQDNN